MITLRDYQQDVYDGIRQSMLAGHKRVLATLPCGAGKSYIIGKIAENCKGEVLVLTHRRELLDQTGDLLRQNGVSARMSMILTEANRLGQYQKPALVITDEAHLSRAQSWVKVLNYYDTHVVGFTATPIRLDGKPLGDVYDDLIVGVGVNELIKLGRLSPYEYYAPTTVDTDGLRVVAGDYVTKDIEKLMMDRAIYSDVLKSWKQLAKGEKTIAYCVSVKHAKQVAQMFNDAGIPAAEIDGTTPSDVRSETMARFRRGEFKILCNVGIISEGVSIDDVTCCLLLRPTESLALFWQQGMRCMRYLPGKTAKIIDCVANYTRNPLFDMDVEWSLTRSTKKQVRFNEEGDYTVRRCLNCFNVFKTAPVCPYCGTPYQLEEKELKQKQDIELKRISREEAEEAERQRKKMRQEVGRARTLPELLAIARERGYSPAWAYKMMQVRNRG